MCATLMVLLSVMVERDVGVYSVIRGQFMRLYFTITSYRR